MNAHALLRHKSEIRDYDSQFRREGRGEGGEEEVVLGGRHAGHRDGIGGGSRGRGFKEDKWNGVRWKGFGCGCGGSDDQMKSSILHGTTTVTVTNSS